jgi:sulfofructose kinase
MDVIGIGESSIDYVYRVPVLPHAGGPTKVRLSRASVSPGGQVATTLCACAAMGLSASYVGGLGNDANGRIVLQVLQQHGVGTDGSIVREGTSRYAVILVEDRTGERLVVWHQDPKVSLRPEDVPADRIRQARLLHVDGVDEAIALHAAAIARDAGIPVTVDIDHASTGTRELAAAVTIPIFGEGVPEALTGEPDTERALRRLRGAHPLVCVTLGARGAMLLAGDTLHAVGGHAVDVVDTTGAGDVFRGAFIDAYLRGATPDRVLRFANAAGALSCTRDGAIASVPSREEIERMVLS